MSRLLQVIVCVVAVWSVGGCGSSSVTMPDKIAPPPPREALQSMGSAAGGVRVQEFAPQ